MKFRRKRRLEAGFSIDRTRKEIQNCLLETLVAGNSFTSRTLTRALAGALTQDLKDLQMRLTEKKNVPGCTQSPKGLQTKLTVKDVSHKNLEYYARIPFFPKGW